MLEVRSVLKRFGGATVVDDASLSVAAGGIVGLIGPMGRQNHTLNLIAGSIALTSGKYFSKVLR
jgi:ABC-type branched-subunit amino acid transport system ATPase component